MKIAVVSEGWEPIYGGGQVHVEFLCKYLVRDFNVEVDLFTRKLIDDAGRIYDDNEVHENNKRRIFRIGPVGRYFTKWKRVVCLVSMTIALFKAANKHHYSLIHAHALLAGIPAWIVGKLLSIPVIYTVHGSIHLDSGRKNIYYYIEQFLICRLQYAAQIFVSHATLHYPNRNKNRVVIHNGVDISRFSKATSTPQKLLSMLTVGRVDRQKNHVAVIDALSNIDKSKLDAVGFQWVVVGDGPLLDYCQEQVKRHKLEKYITFTGKLFGTELVDVYHNTNVFILPSLAEGQPLTILEAFAAGLPIIATDVGDNEYIITNKENGLLVPVNDIKALQNAIEFCIDTTNIGLLASRGQEGKLLVERDYDWHTIIAKTYKVYSTVLQ